MSQRDDFDLPPTEEELREAARLRDALDRGEAPLADALRAAHAPGEISARRNAELVEAAIAAAPARRSGTVIRVVFGVSTVLAAAAAVALFATRTVELQPSLALSRSRSTEDLFDQPFPREGGTSARVDRIASARQRDLRKNQYARWGVK